MNRPLAYLWITLAKRRALHLLSSLRRPTTLVGFGAVVCLVGVCFHFRKEEFMGYLVDPRSLIGAALLMVGGALFRGFLQRGLVFEPADLEFLFTSPFTQRQILAYRLFSNYCFALGQSLVFLILFASHLKHPLTAALCLTLFQIACFHLATAASIFGGSIPELLHQRLRWMILGVFAFLIAFYLRVAWDLKIVPHVLGSPLAGLLFYPAVTVSDIANDPILHGSLGLLSASASSEMNQLGRLALYLAAFGTLALGSGWALLRQKADIFEPSLDTTTRHAERRRRIEQGRQAAVGSSDQARSHRLPHGFRGVGAIVWKNLVVASRSRKELAWVTGFAVIYTGFIIALLYLYHFYSRKAGYPPPTDEVTGFHIGVALFLATLTFFLQRMVPFDFRRDGHHLLNFRTLPFGSLGIAFAQLVVPTAFCLALQVPCIVALLFYGRFPWLLTLLLPLAYPAVALALNTVWNIHYLIAANQRAAGQSVSAVGTLMVVALSFMVFYPAGWVALRIGQHLPEHTAIQLPLVVWILVQYLVDLLLLMILARLYHRIEVCREIA